ncbi:cell wall-active antibiotics response protein LiaF [Aneurinibacillus uraniidurans]|uniref:cell wall-active antibiotics response protein LiaF n=1 Tax=Aneurinibacillus uraniidurans TaxID=2966586 RepID=UPI0023497930|nr:cell wall-active antibiotics response protein LiaF [Aneurinibacillus sp. B1]WCN39443.1 cell wall-active antibiotics response protein LiaF [Aneurinibacillus sp. B1]
MPHRSKTDFINWAIFISLIMLLLELSFSGGGAIFFVGSMIGCIYIGHKRLPRLTGKLFFWFGVVNLGIAVLNTVAFRFWAFILIAYIVVQFAQSKKNPHLIHPILGRSQPIINEETLVVRTPMFRNIWLGPRQTPEHAYEWNDIIVQTGIGDTVIDLSSTVLPKQENVIVIRNLVGNVQVLIPYDVGVSVHHSAVAGAATVFEYQEPTAFNRVLHIETPGYGQAGQKVKIMTVMLVGDLEVKRI